MFGENVSLCLFRWSHLPSVQARQLELGLWPTMLFVYSWCLSSRGFWDQSLGLGVHPSEAGQCQCHEMSQSPLVPVWQMMGCHQTIDGTVVMERKLHWNTKNKAGQTNLIVFRQKIEVRECHGYTWIWQAFAKEAYDSQERKLNQFGLDKKTISSIKSRLLSY